MPGPRNRVLEDMCGYNPSRGISYYTERLAALMQVVGRSRGQSTHAYTKEVRRALEALVYAVWDRYEEFVRDISRSQVPEELRAA